MRNLRAVSVTLVICAMLLTTSCRVKRPTQDHAQQQILYSSMVGDPRTFNPVTATDFYSDTVIGPVFEGLIRINELTALPEPGLAEKWEIADDQKTITFHLRHEVKWSDGAPFTSHDVAFTLEVMYDTRVPNSMRSILLIGGKQIGVETPDDYTLVLHLPRPFAPLMYSI